MVEILFFMSWTLLFASMVLSWVLFSNITSPVACFGAVYGISFLIFSVNLTNRDALSFDTYLSFILAIVFFYLGSFMAYLIKNKKIEKDRYSILTINYDILIVIMKYVVLISLAGTLLYVFTVVSGFGLKFFINHPRLARSAMTGQYFDAGYFSYVTISLVFVGAILGGVINRYNYKIKIGYMPLLMSGVINMFYLSRAMFLVTLIMYVTGLFVRTDRSVKSIGKIPGNNNKLIPILVLSVVGFIAIGFVTYQRYETTDRASIYDVLEPYVVNVSQNWILVDKVINTNRPLSFGVNTFYCYAKLLYEIGLIDENPRNIALFSTNLGLTWGGESNTYTFIGHLFDDFGMSGVVIGYFLFGFICIYAYINYKDNAALFSLALVCFSYAEIIFSVQGSQIATFQFNLALIVFYMLFLTNNKITKEINNYKNCTVGEPQTFS
ncbi:MAG: oligosaccharide repeat unit polymerase [Proteobacteria bacterium]|nr:oligosaccharide repeat unit polymerase [Pseudomonadota bacterium]